MSLIYFMWQYLGRFGKYQKGMIFLFLFLSSSAVFADHIVGGNIEMIALDKTPGRYKVVVKVYYDKLDNPSRGEQLGIFIYRKSDKLLMRTLSATRVPSKQKLLKPANATCANQKKFEIAFDQFEQEMTLDPKLYNDAGGYVLTWNPCCRSQAVSNITFPDKRAILFYTEFPPLVKDGKPFVDSTPEFNDIDAEYICLGDDFTYSFAATDRDGDELRYSLVTPYSIYDRNNGWNNTFGPIIAEFIDWASGYSATNAIPGNPALSINANGQLSVKASEAGLFVFSVLVEEYRNGIKIGAARREFQLFVFDCPPLIPPEPTITANDQPTTQVSVCQGASVVLKSTINNNWGYQWTKDGNNIAGAESPTFNATESGTYQLITFFKDQCSKTRLSRKVEIDVTTSIFKLKTNGLPKICSGNSLSILSPDNPNYVYEWYKDGQKLSTNTATLLAIQAGRYWAVLKNNVKGCSSKSDTLVVSAVILPIPVVSSLGNINEICRGDSLLLSGSQNSSYTYQWTRNDTLLSSKTSKVFGRQSGDYKLTITDTTGCKNTSAAFKLGITKSIPVTLDSIAALCGSDYPKIKLIGKPTGGVFTGNGVLANEFDPKLAGIGTHTIRYTVNSTSACQSGTAQRTAVVQPIPNVSAGVNALIFRGASTRLGAAANDPNLNYSWFPPLGIDNPNIARPLASPNETTVYELKATDKYGCSAASKVTVQVYNGVWIPDVFTPNGDGQNDKWELKGIEAYPTCEVTIYNRWGAAIFYSKGYVQPWDGSIDEDPALSGAYSYTIVTPIQILRGMVLVVR